MKKIDYGCFDNYRYNNSDVIYPIWSYKIEIIVTYATCLHFVQLFFGVASKTVILFGHPCNIKCNGDGILHKKLPP